jgi:hypothetical protein
MAWRSSLPVVESIDVTDYRVQTEVVLGCGQCLAKECLSFDASVASLFTGVDARGVPMEVTEQVDVQIEIDGQGGTFEKISVPLSFGMNRQAPDCADECTYEPDIQRVSEELQESYESIDRYKGE